MLDEAASQGICQAGWLEEMKEMTQAFWRTP
jgi:hypothetical protein